MWIDLIRVCEILCRNLNAKMFRVKYFLSIVHVRYLEYWMLNKEKRESFHWKNKSWTCENLRAYGQVIWNRCRLETNIDSKKYFVFCWESITEGALAPENLIHSSSKFKQQMFYVYLDHMVEHAAKSVSLLHTTGKNSACSVRNIKYAKSDFEKEWLIKISTWNNQ